MGKHTTTNPDSLNLDESYPVYTFDHLEKYKPNPDNYILGDGWLKRGAAANLVSSTGVGKSVMVEQAACNIATGTPWLGRIHTSKPYKVLLIEAENDEDVLKEDLMGIVGHYKLDKKLINKNLIIRHAPGIPEGYMGDFLDINLKRFGADVVIIDPYQSYIGSNDINATAPFYKWRDEIEEVIQAHNAALLLTTHTPKPRNRDDWNTFDMVYASAGTQGLSSWVRTSCEMFAVGKEVGKYRLHFSKNGGRTGMRDEDGHVIRNVMIEWSSEDGKPYWKVSEDQNPITLLNKKKAVIEFAEKHPDMSQVAVASALGVSTACVNMYYPNHLRKKPGKQPKDAKKKPTKKKTATKRRATKKK